jgi:predicted DNA-binding protein
MAKARKPNSSDRLKKHQMAIYIEPEQYEALKALSTRTRVPQQVYIREGIDMVLATHKKEGRK